jgi:hypothetical protein
VEPTSKLGRRVIEAAEAALTSQGYVCAIDVLTGIRWLDLATLQRWQQGQLACLEAGIQTHSQKVAAAMALFWSWASERGLHESEADYFARNPSRTPLQFSESGDAALERRYRIHWLSAELSERQRDRLRHRANRPPELVAIQALGDWTCHRCGGTGALLIMEPPGPACLPCAGLGDLVFLPAGDAALTRRAKAKSARHVAVVRFSRARKRYERQGLLVEPGVLPASRDSVD